MFEFFQSNSYLVNHIVLTETNSTFILMSNMAAFFSEKEIKIQFSNLHKLNIHLDIQTFKLKSIDRKPDLTYQSDSLFRRRRIAKRKNASFLMHPTSEILGSKILK